MPAALAIRTDHRQGALLRTMIWNGMPSVGIAPLMLSSLPAAPCPSTVSQGPTVALTPSAAPEPAARQRGGKAKISQPTAPATIQQKSDRFCRGRKPCVNRRAAGRAITLLILH